MVHIRGSQYSTVIARASAPAAGVEYRASQRVVDDPVPETPEEFDTQSLSPRVSRFYEKFPRWKEQKKELLKPRM